MGKRRTNIRMSGLGGQGVVTSAHVLSREDYAACMLDSLGNPEHHRRTLTVVAASG